MGHMSQRGIAQGSLSTSGELGSVSESKKVQSLRRLSILCNSRLVFFFPASETFFKSISNNEGEAVFVIYVVCICAACLEEVGPDL